MKYFWGIVLIVVSLSSCYYNNEEDLTGVIACDISAVKYSTDVAKIMDDYCNACHSTDQKQGKVILDSYSQVATYVKNGKLMGSIQHKFGYSAMPKNAGRMNNCSIATIKAWIDKGYPND